MSENEALPGILPGRASFLFLSLSASGMDSGQSGRLQLCQVALKTDVLCVFRFRQVQGILQQMKKGAKGLIPTTAGPDGSGVIH